MLTECACGCGEKLDSLDSRGRERRFIHNHHWRGKPKPFLENPESTAISTGHTRARRTVGIDECELAHIGGCRSRLHVHHRDGNPMNNDPTNLMRLCVSHHLLLHSGRIDPDAPVMPSFYIRANGQRRYVA